MFPGWFLLCLLARDDPLDASNAPSPDQQFRALADAHEVAYRDFVKSSLEAKTEADYEAVNDHPGRNPRAFAPGFMSLAEKYPGTSAAEDALIWVCSHTSGTRESEEATRLLTRDHVKGPKLGPALGYQGHYAYYFEGTERFFRAVLAESTHRELQGLACYWLARHLLRQADGVRWVREGPDFSALGFDPYADVYGADWADRLRRLDPETLEREAEALFQRVVENYADVPHNDKRRLPAPLGEVARSYLRDLRELALGRPAPETEGTDLEGRPFRLSDYQGRVVVLDFGSHFYCGLCHEMYPQLRTLIDKYKGRPFDVISINAEPEKSVSQLKEAWAAVGNTWRCVFDGTWEGPIQKAWNVHDFPTIYVLDGKGLIRGKRPGARDLDELVGALLNKGPR